MTKPELTEWNRKLIEETIAVLESSRASTTDTISRLSGFLAVNPGSPTMGPLPEMDGRKAGPVPDQPKCGAGETQEKPSSAATQTPEDYKTACLVSGIIPFSFGASGKA
jgi:hypothetical protein